MATFEQLMNGFGVVTVMNACIYELAPDKRYAGRSACQHNSAQGGALLPSDWLCTGEYLDTLKIANLNQEGPTKTVTGGQYANPLIKYGKTCTAEMQDALGRASTMVRFFGADYCTKVKYEQGKSYSRDYYGDGETTDFIMFVGAADSTMATKSDWAAKDLDAAATVDAVAYDADTKGIKITLSAAPAAGDRFALIYTPSANKEVGCGRLSITDKFPGAFAIEGDSFFIDQKTGDKVDVHIFIPQFLPDAIFNFSQDAEGDATVFDLNGTLCMTKVADANGLEPRDIFYEIRDTRYFEGVGKTADHV